ncbi:MAG: DUF2784 domain-containing protein [Methylosarcina sp.]
MLNLILADLVVAIHFGFIVFVVLGGLLALKWRELVWLHFPAAFWGALIEFAGWICPLTLIENWLRAGSGYSSGFIEHYLIPIIYPSVLTREMQWGLGLTVVLINVMVYGRYYKKWIE